MSLRVESLLALGQTRYSPYSSSGTNRQMVRCRGLNR
ncbi:Uncharacterised protein [Vibrio cholerae]|nr:Uncharacterised protein [Vibrio cholerae]